MQKWQRCVSPPSILVPFKKGRIPSSIVDMYGRVAGSLLLWRRADYFSSGSRRRSRAYNNEKQPAAGGDDDAFRAALLYCALAP